MLLTMMKAKLHRATVTQADLAVAEGEGSSRIGDETFHWKKNDVFTVPHWTWASHTASAPNTRRCPNGSSDANLAKRSAYARRGCNGQFDMARNTPACRAPSRR